jgi:hypothetical protein
MSAAEAEAMFKAKFNLSPSDASSGAGPDPGEEKMRRRVLRANSPCTAAAEEEMREAGAREVCEETRGVGGVLARNNIAAVPKANKGKTRMKGTQEAWGAAGGRQGEEGMCGDFADLALEPSLGLEPLSALIGASSAEVDSRECAPANATHQDLTRFQAPQGICIIQHICKSTASEGVCVCTGYIASMCVCIHHTQVVAWCLKTRILGMSAQCAWTTRRTIVFSRALTFVSAKSAQVRLLFTFT